MIRNTESIRCTFLRTINQEGGVPSTMRAKWKTSNLGAKMWRVVLFLLVTIYVEGTGCSVQPKGEQLYSISPGATCQQKGIIT